MFKKQNTLYIIVSLILGILSGIFGTAFSMGANRQRVDDILLRHTTEIVGIRIEQKDNEKATQKDLDRFTEILADQIDGLQKSITNLTDTVSDLRIDVQVLKVLIERIEKDIRENKNPD